MLTLGIATTIADAGDSIEEFIFYHKKIGFNQFYIFVDDNDIEVFDKVMACEGVHAFIRGRELAELWKKYIPSLAEQKIKLVDVEVMVRQELNFCVAYDLAKQHNVDWLLHIDLDELFYPNGHGLIEYFGRLQFNNIRSLTHLNYESISAQLECDSIYRSSTYFKVNYFKNRYWFYTSEQQAFLADNEWLKEKYFLFYQNGKSSVSTYGNKMHFYDVHSIMGDGQRKLGGHNDPIVLHFPCARLSDFMRKYRRLGGFSNDWMGAPRAGNFIDCFHLDARDVFKTASVSECKVFYEKHCILDPTQITSLCELGLAKFIDFHMKIFEC